MLLVREVMHCKPGQVKPMVQMFLKMSEISVRAGMPKMRVMTDFVAEQYWTIVCEFEVESLQAFEDMMSGKAPKVDPALMKEMEAAGAGYHEHVVNGKREIYRIEG